MTRSGIRLVGALGAAAVVLVTAGRPAAATDHVAPAIPTIAGINLDQATIPQLERAMDAGRFSSVQLVAVYQRRIQALNPKLHAVITVNPDAARDAQASDERRAARHAGALEGIPVLVKDNIGTGDLEPTTAGSWALIKADPKDAFLVTRLRAAGAVILGKANLSEWANFRSTHSSSGWSGVEGQTHNPYVLNRNPCGSSSGSAVAAAADLATVTVGTETNGSIVCPAGSNGDVGLKPTLGLVSRTDVVPISAEQDTAGPITRNVTDTAVLLGALTGVDPADPATKASAGQARSDYTPLLRATALAGARIGVWDADAASSSPTTEAVFQAGLTTLRRSGATVVPLPSGLPHLSVVYKNSSPALLTEFHHDINAYLQQLPGQHPRSLAGLITFNQQHAQLEMPYFGQEIFELAQKATPSLHDPAYLRARRAATFAAQRSIDETLATFHLDAIVAPTNGPAWNTDLRHGDDFSGPSSSTPAAVAGYPDVTVPMGQVSQLPVGMSFFAGRWSEPTLIPLAYSFEQHAMARRPPHFLPSVAIPGEATGTARPPATTPAPRYAG